MANVKRDARGLVITVAIFAIWAGSLGFLLSRSSVTMPLAFFPVGIVWMTFLYTGLFIAAHDAIHGTVWPGHPRVNTWTGRVILFLYALFPYRKVREKHFQHHKTPGRLADTDYHDGRHTGFLAWYVHFMRNYLTAFQVVGMAVLFNLLHHALGVALPNLLAFWVAPALLSTLQLFTFGTYLPHREPPGGYANVHHARSLDYPVWLSFLACYHFGYHWEHHSHPRTPWWQLPQRWRARLAGEGG